MKTISKNGNIYYPIRGEPPEKCPEGYEKDPKDPFVCRPILPPCVHRILSVVAGCCGTKTEVYCNYFNESIELRRCVGCPHSTN